MAPRHTLAATCCTTLALAAPALAGGGSEEWTSLDREIAALAQAASSTAQAPEGVRVSGVLRANYAWFDEPDYSAFALDNVRPRFDAAVGDFAFQIELEGQSNTALLLEAWAGWQIADAFHLTMGRYQPPVLRSALVDPEHLLFILRTTGGTVFQFRDEGAQLAARFDPFLLRASLENGEDGAGDESAYTLRADWDVVGGGVRLVEGAYGSGSQWCFTLGAAYRDDQGLDEDGDVITVDAAMTYGRFSLMGEWLSFGDGFVAPDVDPAAADQYADTSPWAAAASFMLDPEKYELALRYEQPDAADTVDHVWTLGLIHYVSGHDVKWMLNAAYVSTDPPGDAEFDNDGLRLGVGLTINV
jgi:hypothetical protein